MSRSLSPGAEKLRDHLRAIYSEPMPWERERQQEAVVQAKKAGKSQLHKKEE